MPFVADRHTIRVLLVLGVPRPPVRHPRGEPRDIQPVSRRRTAPVHRMLTLTIVDQGASSVSNFALAVVVAHYSGARALGIFALVTSTYVVTQGMVRSFSSDCLLTRVDDDPLVMARYERGGFLAAGRVVESGGVGGPRNERRYDSRVALPFMVFALSFPFIAMQDFSRYVGIRRHDPAYAIRLDMAWLVLFLLAYVVLDMKGLVSMPWLFGAWTVSGAAVGLITLRSSRTGDSRAALGFWLNSERVVGARFAGQFLVASVSNYLIFYLLVLFVISVAAVGTIKLALLALGPVAVMSAGVQSALIPLTSKRFCQDRAGALRFLFVAGMALALGAAAWSVLLYVAPVHLVRSVLGPAWPQARLLLPFGGLSFMAMCVAGAGTCGLRAMRAAKENLGVAVGVLALRPRGPALGRDALGRPRLRRGGDGRRRALCGGCVGRAAAHGRQVARRRAGATRRAVLRGARRQSRRTRVGAGRRDRSIHWDPSVISDDRGSPVLSAQAPATRILADLRCIEAAENLVADTEEPVYDEEAGRGRPLIVVHDYSGHPGQAQLSRALARRGHRVVHQHCPSYATGKGALDRICGDPADLSFEPCPMRGTFKRYSVVDRLGQEWRYGLEAGRLIANHHPDVAIISNVPLLAHAVIALRLQRRGIPTVFWHQDIYSEAISTAAKKRLPRPRPAHRRWRPTNRARHCSVERGHCGDLPGIPGDLVGMGRSRQDNCCSELGSDLRAPRAGSPQQLERSDGTFVGPRGDVLGHTGAQARSERVDVHREPPDAYPPACASGGDIGRQG